VPAEIIGLGVAVPPYVLTNADLEELVDTNDQWITERTGIKERRIAGKDDSTALLGKRAPAAAPTEPKHPGNPGGNTPEQCTNKPHNVCCNGGLLGGILCNVAILGNACSGESYCCANAPQTGLINIGLLGCTKIL